MNIRTKWKPGCINIPKQTFPVSLTFCRDISRISEPHPFKTIVRLSELTQVTKVKN